MQTRLTSTKLASVGSKWRTAARRALADSNVTITQIGAEAGCSRQYITRAIDGETPTLPVETYLIICRRLGLDPNNYADIDRTTPPWESSE